MQLTSEKLKEILVSSGYVNEAEFDDAAQTAIDLSKPIQDILIFRGLITGDALAKLIAENLNVPYIDIRGYRIPDDALATIPEKMARSYKMVPMAIDNGSLKLAMENPGDVEAIEFAKRHTGMAIIPHYATHDDIKRALNQYKRNIKADFERVISENIQQAGPLDDLSRAAENLPIVKVFDTLLEYAAAERASDIHLESGEHDVIVRYRIDGVLRDIIKLPKAIEEALVARVKILSNLKLDERRVPQDGRHKFTIGDEAISLRISIIPGFYGENVVARLLHESERPNSLEELGIVGNNLAIIKENIQRPHGMILVTGPTGSGKTTTLYSILNMLNTIKVKICTIEDPIEYGIGRVTQIQVNSKTGMDFAAGLRALLRHDPDIMMVGEIRDKETAEIAVHSALTGHLVLSTLHTNDAAGAVPRLLDMGIEGYLAASTINAVIAQRLVRKIDPQYAKEYMPSADVLAQLSRSLGHDLTGQRFYRPEVPEGVKASGFSGRIGIYEVLPVTEEIRALITKKGSSDIIIDKARELGMISMVQDGLSKVSSGFTTIEEVMRAVQEN